MLMYLLFRGHNASDLFSDIFCEQKLGSAAEHFGVDMARGSSESLDAGLKPK